MYQLKPLPQSHAFPKAIFPIAFLHALSIALPIYIGSSYLAAFVGEPRTGYIFTLAAITSIVLMAIGPAVSEKIGNLRASLGAIACIAALFYVLAGTESSIVAVIAFGAYLSFARLTVFQLDIFLEDLSDDQNTGSMRGAYLTASNVGILLAPVIAGTLMSLGGFSAVYSIAAAVTVILCLSVFIKFRTFRDPAYEKIRLTRAISSLIKDKNLRKIASANLLLFVFYSWMVVYLPLYLNTRVGFSWTTIGALFAIMLAPFVLLQWPLGRLADKRLGEKELLMAGFAIAAIASAGLSFITNNSFWLWAVILASTRVGASAIEIMVETYFFKHVDGKNDHLLGAFRMTSPLGYIIGPGLAALFLTTFDIRFLFLVLGFVMLLGIPLIVRLEDTR